MNKQQKSVICLLLLCCLLATTVFPVFAVETEPEPTGTEIRISSVEEFLSFASDCILDTYSQNMTVYLDTDLDLADVTFTGIPIFSGTFEGNDHSIYGLSITTEGSVQGMFRYLTATAKVKNLTVCGKVLPAGSQKTVGGIAGDNSGSIENCVFRGEVAGNDYVGGLVGTNRVSGIIEACRVSGNIHGNHFVGGLAGENLGTIRNCKNLSSINTTATDNSVELSDISSSTILGTESAHTVTDIGGIAGTSTGVIRSCENHGTVGYQHMGYNIGGIAGSQKGYITECKNYSNVYGRKEVAGIVGQIEPVSEITYSADTLQILRKQLATTSALASKASSNVHNNAQNLNGQMSSLHQQADTAIDAVKQLIPSEENPHFPDQDAIQAAKNTLSSSMSSMQSTITSINSSTQAGISSVSNDIHAITNQINAISNTLDNATQNLGGTVTDVSDSDTVDDLSGKISLCENLGPVSGDLNIGGIVGAVAWENDLDPENDFHFIGNQSLHFDSKLRAVIVDSQNNALISAKKRNAGGIAGNLFMGLIKNCINTGFVEADGAEHVGGIAGTSSGFIRNCSAKCELQGDSFVGGIAGKAPVVTDCRSMVLIKDGTEKLGSIIGISTESDASVEHPISGNYYLPESDNLGAIDGINYAGIGESLPLDAFLALENLPDVFIKATVTFLYEDGSIQEIAVPLGEVIETSQIPAVPEKAGYTGKWDKLEDTDLQNVRFDVIMQPEYVSCRTVIQSKTLRDNGKPLLLAEGQFREDTQLDLIQLEETPSFENSMTAVEAWSIPSFAGEETVLHFALPENMNAKSAKILVQNSEGTWSEVPHEVDGSYLVFSVASSDQAICVASAAPMDLTQFIILAAAIIVVILMIVVFIIRKKKRASK